MPRRLIATAPRTPVLQEYRDEPLSNDQVRIKCEFSAPKHGTEMAYYRGTSAEGKRRYDPEYRMFFPEKSPSPAGVFPIWLGNTSVGVVTEVGPKVTRYKVGDRVYGHMSISETHTLSEARVEGKVPDGMSPHAIAYWDPAQFAFGAVRDGHVRIGDRVAVFGLGAIGFMTAQLARLSGADKVFVVDPIEKRRKLALKHGADAAFDPMSCDAGKALKDATGKVGPDVTIEASGNYRALQEAIRCCAPNGNVVALAYYQGEPKGIDFGDEWHLNAVTVISSRACTEPNREAPRWSNARIMATSWDWLRTGKLKVDGLIDPIVHVNDSVAAYRAIDENPASCVKLGVVYE